MLKSLTAVLLLAAATLAVAPTASAYEMPPQCMTVDSCCGIEPGFAPCCTLLECPPSLVRCPIVDRWEDGIHVTVSPSCEVVVEVKQYDCVWNCGWVTYLQGPPVTLRVYQQTDGSQGSSSSGIEPWSPCGPTVNCEPPTCTPQELVSEGLPFMLVVRLDGDCSITVTLADPECPPGTVAGQPVHADGAVVSASAETCQIDLVCTCDPILEPASAADLPSLDDLFQPCPGMGGCCGIEPPEGGCCSPTCPVTLCPPLSLWTTPVLAPQASVAVQADCTVDAGVRAMPCPSFAPDRQPVATTVGPVQASGEVCLPYLVCTCPPLQATSASADLEPPVWVEFVVCVDGPCPPQVYCKERAGSLPLHSYEVSRSCHVTVTQEPFVMCEGLRQESTTYGPVTYVRWYCGPGIQE